MSLRWEQDGHGDWRGHSGAQRVAVAHKAFDGRDRWYWAVFVGPAHDREGIEDTPEAARAAAEAAWRAWREGAGLAQVPVWQPIETAPRDGTPVLVAVAGGGFHADKAQWIVCRGDAEIRERWTYPCGKHGPALEPTHWMPLPPPPDAAGADDGGGLVPAYKSAGEGDGA